MWKTEIYTLPSTFVTLQNFLGRKIKILSSLSLTEQKFSGTLVSTQKYIDLCWQICHMCAYRQQPCHWGAGSPLTTMQSVLPDIVSYHTGCLPNGEKQTCKNWHVHHPFLYTFKHCVQGLVKLMWNRLQWPTIPFHKAVGLLPYLTWADRSGLLKDLLWDGRGTFHHIAPIT